MTEEDAFLFDILARPDDDAARLIYADWLTDRDDERGDWVRESFLLRSVPATDPARDDFAHRCRRAAQQHGWQEYDGLMLTWEQMVQVFRFRLAEVIAHCAGDLPPLRTWELEPRSLICLASAGWPLDDEAEWRDMSMELAIARRRLLERGGRAPMRQPIHLAGGRLVAFMPSGSLSDGAACAESKAFFDNDNVPAWDTWVMYVSEATASPGWPATVGRGYLLAWVPPPWLHWATAGINVNPEGCIVWSGDISTPFLRRLRQAGMQGC